MLNKPFKDAVKTNFQDWCKDQILKQLEEGVPPDECRLDLSLGTIREQSVGWIMAAWVRAKELQSSVLAGLEGAGSLQIFEPAFQREAAKQQEKWSIRPIAATPVTETAEPAPEELISGSSAGSSERDLEEIPDGSDWDSDFDQPIDKKQVARLENVWKKEDRLRKSTMDAAAATASKNNKAANASSEEDETASDGSESSTKFEESSEGS